MLILISRLFRKAKFDHVPHNCGMAYLRQCLQVDTTWVHSNSASTTTLKSGNAPVASLVLHGVAGGGDHLPSGDPVSSKKNKEAK